MRQWDAIREPLLASLLTRWPPVRSVGPLLARIGATQVPDFVRFALLPVDRMGAELFGGARAGQILSGNAMHADIPPEALGSGVTTLVGGAALSLYWIDFNLYGHQIVTHLAPGSAGVKAQKGIEF